MKAVGLSLADIDFIFLRLEIIYGHLWSSKHQHANVWKIAKSEWHSALLDIPLSCAKKALDRLRLISDEFPPTLPKFRKLCDEACGVPTLEESYRKAVQRDFADHQIIKLAFLEMGGDFALGNESDRETRKKFELAYARLIVEYREHMLYKAAEVLKLNSRAEQRITK